MLCFPIFSFQKLAQVAGATRLFVPLHVSAARAVSGRKPLCSMWGNASAFRALLTRSKAALRPSAVIKMRQSARRRLAAKLGPDVQHEDGRDEDEAHDQHGHGATTEGELWKVGVRGKRGAVLGL